MRDSLRLAVYYHSAAVIWLQSLITLAYLKTPISACRAALPSFDESADPMSCECTTCMCYVESSSEFEERTNRRKAMN